jgi:hypothetical protein
MYLVAQTVVYKAPVVVHHIYLWQIVAAGIAVALAAVLIVIVLTMNFRRAKENVEE